MGTRIPRPSSGPRQGPIRLRSDRLAHRAMHRPSRNQASWGQPQRYWPRWLAWPRDSGQPASPTRQNAAVADGNHPLRHCRCYCCGCCCCCCCCCVAGRVLPRCWRLQWQVKFAAQTSRARTMPGATSGPSLAVSAGPLQMPMLAVAAARVEGWDRRARLWEMLVETTTEPGAMAAADKQAEAAVPGPGLGITRRARRARRGVMACDPPHPIPSPPKGSHRQQALARTIPCRLRRTCGSWP